jgi:hypothetical protein
MFNMKLLRLQALHYPVSGVNLKGLSRSGTFLWKKACRFVMAAETNRTAGKTRSKTLPAKM